MVGWAFHARTPPALAMAIWLAWPAPWFVAETWQSCDTAESTRVAPPGVCSSGSLAIGSGEYLRSWVIFSR